MKKQLIIAALVVATSVSGFAQGYVVFSTTKAAGLWYAPNATASGSVAERGNGGIKVGFMWAASGTPAVGSLGTSTSVANTTVTWASILTEPTFQFAQNAGSLVTMNVNASGIAQGGFNYNSGVSFPLQGSVAGSTIQAFAVAWSSAYATPELASAGNSFLGYSKVISYVTGPTAGSGISTFALSGMPAFGVNAVPEPATFALAGLGIAAMLVSRRRK